MPATQQKTVKTGRVVGPSPREGARSDQCQDAGACDPSTGLCSSPAKPDGTSCSDDGNPCTADMCSGGACTHTPVGDGTACSDGNACTSNDVCSNGTCAGTAYM